MQIIAFSRLEDISPYAETWDRLARGVPSRSWGWLSTWWRHNGSQSPANQGSRLMILGVLDPSGRLAGIAPWYLSRSADEGWMLRWLGSGEVRSDCASILCLPEDADRVTESIAAYLTGPHCSPGARNCWDFLEIDGVDARDSSVTRLLRQLGERGCTQHEYTPQCTRRLTLRIMPDRRTSPLRNNLWLAGRDVNPRLNQSSQRSTLQAAGPADPWDARRARLQPGLDSLSLASSW